MRQFAQPSFCEQKNCVPSQATRVLPPSRPKGPPHGGLGQQRLHALETGLQQRGVRLVERNADIIVGGNSADAEQGLAVGAALSLLQRALKGQNDELCTKNIENAVKPKSVIAILPPRPFRKSGKVTQAAFKPHRREGKSCIPTVNQTFADLRILKSRTLELAGDTPEPLTDGAAVKDALMAVASFTTRPVLASATT